MVQLRDYQIEAVDSIFKYYNDGHKGNPIIVAATGSGKSLIIAELIRKLTQEYGGQRIVMATHVEELIVQNFGELLKQAPGVDAGIYSAALGHRHHWQQVIYGSIQSMIRKSHLFGHRQFIIIDECHLLSDKNTAMYQRFIKALKNINPTLKVIGLTATPWRMKGGSLLEQKNAIFTDITYEVGIKELLAKGHLCKLISKQSAIQANMEGVRTVAGEFNVNEMEDRLDNESLMVRALEEINKLAEDRKYFLFFCAGLKHSAHALTLLRQQGWEAEMVTGSTPKEERRQIIDWFKKPTSTRKALVNNAVLTTGTNLPHLDCIILWRATKSSVLYIQMLGRGMRNFQDKPNCLVLDYAGNIERFGCVEYVQPNKPGRGGDAPYKECPECHLAVHPRVMECPECKYIFPPPEEAPKHNTNATMAAVSEAELAPEEVVVVDVLYKEHISKETGIPTLRVMYYDRWGYVASEYICFEHIGRARKEAELWHMERSRDGALQKLRTIPSKVSDALENANVGMYIMPKKIFLRQQGKYKEVAGYES